MSGAGTSGAALLAAVAETTFEALPKPAVEMGRLAMLDWWGVTVGGVDEPVACLLREAAPEAEGPASVLGTDLTVSPVTAALWNGTASHALDYDDTVLALPGHVTAPLLPGLVALAETRGLSGRDVLAAFVLGVEVMCRVSRALAPGHYRAGWHATATLGRLGGAAACARLLGLDAEGIDRAVGLAAAQLGGIHESFGTMGKPFQVGRAAADGLLAAMLAARGMTGPAGILDRPAWARRLSPDWTPPRLSEGLGRDWAVNEVFFKRFPCCFATHAALTALLDLGLRLDPAQIESVDLDVCRTTLLVADQRQPDTGLGGKFSITYCAASALLRGHVREEHFSADAVREPSVRALAARVRLFPQAELDESRARAVVRFRDGSVQEQVGDLRLGRDPERLGRELGLKFESLVEPRLGAGAAARLQDALGRVEALEDLTELTRLTRRRGS
ncbi:MAG TPA: MmgE/PrpD family protein [Methylomirabilota bacterium]